MQKMKFFCSYMYYFVFMMCWNIENKFGNFKKGKVTLLQ